MLLDLLVVFNMAYLWSLQTFLHLVSRTPLDEHYTCQPFVHPRQWEQVLLLTNAKLRYSSGLHDMAVAGKGCWLVPRPMAGDPCCWAPGDQGPEVVYAEYGHSRPHSAETGVGTLVERVFEEVNFANDPSNLSFLPLSVCIHFGQNNFFFFSFLCSFTSCCSQFLLL